MQGVLRARGACDIRGASHRVQETNRQRAAILQQAAPLGKGQKPVPISTTTVFEIMPSVERALGSCTRKAL